MSGIQQLLVVGGTHGNELTGVYWVKQWQRSWHAKRSFNFQIHTLLGNPAAVETNRRYIEKDLNRCFGFSDLTQSHSSVQEVHRAQALVRYIREHAIDFVIDLHTTTSAMGVTLVMSEASPRCCRVAAYVQTKMPEVKIFYEPLKKEDSVYLYTQGRLGGFLVEVGPTPQGLLRADIFQKTAQAVQAVLEGLALYDANALPSKELSVYTFQTKVAFPHNEQGLTAMIHPQRQDQDYEPLHPGDPLFLTFDGETLPYQGDEVVYPVFINEAAYYDLAQGVQGVTLLQRAVLRESVE